MIVPLTLLLSLGLSTPAAANGSTFKNCSSGGDKQECTRQTITEIKARLTVNPNELIPYDILMGLDTGILTYSDQQLVWSLELQDQILNPATKTA